MNTKTVDISVEQQTNQVSVVLPDGTTLKMSPEDLWQFSQASRSWVFANGASMPTPPVISVQKNDVQFKVVVSDNTPFWRRLIKGKWEPETFDILDRFVGPKTTFLDIGSWIGPTLFYAAASAKNAIGFEPDPLAYAELALNVELNRTESWSSALRIANLAVTAESGTISLGSRGVGGDSMSSLLYADSVQREQQWQVDGVRLEELVERYELREESLFIKIDIEGGEYALLPVIGSLLKNLDCGVFLSLHPGIFLRSGLQKTNYSAWQTVRNRLSLAVKHWKIYQVLPFKTIYNQHGKRISILREMLKCLFGLKLQKEWVSVAHW